jgi:hypothetical protein
VLSIISALVPLVSTFSCNACIRAFSNPVHVPIHQVHDGPLAGQSTEVLSVIKPQKQHSS